MNTESVQNKNEEKIPQPEMIKPVFGAEIKTDNSTVDPKDKIAKNSERIANLEQSNLKTKNDLERVRNTLGISASSEVPVSIAKQSETIQRLQTENKNLSAVTPAIDNSTVPSPTPPESDESTPHEQTSETKKISLEERKFKGGIDDMIFTLTSTVQNLELRSENNLTVFMDDVNVNKLRNEFISLKEVDLYSSRGIEQTNQLLHDIALNIGSIDTYSRSVNEDPENLQDLVWSIKEMAEKAAALKHYAKEIDNPDFIQAAKLSAELNEICLKKAGFLDNKLQALLAYLGG